MARRSSGAAGLKMTTVRTPARCRPRTVRPGHEPPGCSAWPITPRSRISCPESLNDIVETYVLDSHRDHFRDLFQTLLAAEGAVLYHCSAGKDRTGVATGLVLTALGVPRETVLADYALSNRYYRMDVSQAATRAPTAEMRMFASLPPEVVKVFQGVEPEYLEAVFQEIDRRYGGFDVYLQKELGVGPAEIAKLKATYLE